MQPAPSTNEVPRLDGLSVLVVDDMAEMRKFLVSILQRQGARAIPAASAAAALEALERERPDVLLADIAMPRQDGYALIRTIRTLPPERGGDIPAAAFTADDDDATGERLLEAGFDFHLAKPVSLEFLIGAVATLALLRPRHRASIAC